MNEKKNLAFSNNFKTLNTIYYNVANLCVDLQVNLFKSIDGAAGLIHTCYHLLAKQIQFPTKQILNEHF